MPYMAVFWLRVPQPELTKTNLTHHYPRFLYKGNGLGGANPWPAYAPREYPRLGFVLLNQGIGQVVLPLRKAIRFPSPGMDVLVLGCKQADHFRAVLLAVPQEGLLLRSDLPEWSCP
jgi:hypothetical protein